MQIYLFFRFLLKYRAQLKFVYMKLLPFFFIAIYCCTFSLIYETLNFFGIVIMLIDFNQSKIYFELKYFDFSPFPHLTRVLN